MARALLFLPSVRAWGAALGLWMTSACLLPQDENYLDPEPLRRNRPLRVVEEQVIPATRFVTVQSGDRCLRTFSFPVADPDIRDRIYVRWYVDDAPVSSPQPVKEQRLEPGPSATRSELALYEVAIDSPGSPLGRLGRYSVEAVVADGALTNRQPEPRELVLPDGEVISDPSYVSTFVWTVDVLDTGCTPGATP